MKNKIIFLICMIPVMIGIGMYTFSFIGELMSAKSDASVAVGLIAIGFIMFSVYLIIKLLIKFLKR